MELSLFTLCKKSLTLMKEIEVSDIMVSQRTGVGLAWTAFCFQMLMSKRTHDVLYFSVTCRSVQIKMLISADLSFYSGKRCQNTVPSLKIASWRHWVPEFRKVKNKNKNIFTYFPNGSKICCALHKDLCKVSIITQMIKVSAKFSYVSQGFFFFPFKLLTELGRFI